MTVLHVENLAKHYGAVRALRGISLEVGEGEIFGLLGRNGAGKTTLIKVALGLVRKTSGGGTILGEPLGSPRSRLRVGFLPEGHDFPGYHTPETLLDCYSAMNELPWAERKRRIPEVLDQVGLGAWRKSKLRTFSKGMKQRLGLAHALIHQPKLMLLDEPTDGVDPVGRKEIRDLLLSLRKRGVTVFLNSHLLGEVEMICDRVAVLELGEVVKEGRVDELTRAANEYQIRVRGPLSKAVAGLASRAADVSVHGDRVDVRLASDVALDGIVDHLRASGVSIRHLEERRLTLEEVFMSLVGTRHEAGGGRKA